MKGNSADVEEQYEPYMGAQKPDHAYRIASSHSFQNVASNGKPNNRKNDMQAFDRKQADMRTTSTITLQVDYSGHTSLSRKQIDLNNLQRVNLDTSKQNYSDIGISTMHRTGSVPKAKAPGDPEAD